MSLEAPNSPSLTVAQIGPWPPPWGGFSVYVKRISEGLLARGHRPLLVSTPDNTSTPPFPWTHATKDRRFGLRAAAFATRWRCDVAHFHTLDAGWKEWLPIAAPLRAAGIPLVISAHSLRREVADFSLADRLGLRAALLAIDTIATSGAHVRERLLALGLPGERVRQVVPFIAPHIPDPPASRLPPKLTTFLATHGPIIAAGANHLVRHEGRDLYGLDVFVAAAAAVLARHPQAGFVFQLPNGGDRSLLAEATATAGRLGMGDALLIHTEPLLEAADLWACADVFARPTRSDGDSISVREALALGTPTLASDAVGRPAGTRTFATGDAKAFADALLATLADLDAARALVRSHRPVDGLDDLIDIYRHAARGRSLGARSRSHILTAAATAGSHIASLRRTP